MDTESNGKPNIVFFFADDQRFDTLGAFGNSEVKTPNLDNLAKRGTFFSNAYIMGGTCGAVCMPSRAMLHSGRTLFHLDRQGQSIPAEHLTLGEVLKKAGYQTFGTGKWHNGTASYARSFTAGDEIFFGGMSDHWNVPAYHFDPTGEYSQRLPICPQPQSSNKLLFRRGDHVDAGKHSSELFADAAIDFLREYRSQEPFFMYISFMAPHDPRTMPEKYLDMYDHETITLPENFMGAHPFDNGELKIRDEMLEDWPRTPQAVRRHIAEYYAMITHMDAQVGRVLEALEQTGQFEHTIIVFAADNGLAVGRHGLMGKQNLYEHSIHIPLLITGPGLPSAAECDKLCYLHDLYPTICELGQAKAPDTVEGKSLLPLLQGEDEGREALYFAYTHVQRAVRRGKDKLIEYVVDGRRTVQLFDLEDDPSELRNLAGHSEHAGRLAEMRELLLDLAQAYDDHTAQGRTFWEGYQNTSKVELG